VSVVPEDRRPGHGAGYWKAWFRLFLALSWLLIAAAISFMPKPRRPAGEAPAWKLVLWLILCAAALRVSLFIFRIGWPHP
jgi:CHASE2 domain-containing sensor protein